MLVWAPPSYLGLVTDYEYCVQNDNYEITETTLGRNMVYMLLKLALLIYFLVPLISMNFGKDQILHYNTQYFFNVHVKVGDKIMKNSTNIQFKTPGL